MQRALRTENPNPDAVHLGRTIPIPQRHWLDKMQLKLPCRHKTPQSQNQELEEKEEKKGSKISEIPESIILHYFIIQDLIFRWIDPLE